MKSKIIFM